MTGNATWAPPSAALQPCPSRVLHELVVLLHIAIEEIPKVPRDEKVEIEDLGNGVHRIVAHYGFMEDSNVPHVLALAREQGLDIELEDTSFFLGREVFIVGKHPAMFAWRTRLFSFLGRNSQNATTWFHIPPDQVDRDRHAGQRLIVPVSSRRARRVKSSHRTRSNGAISGRAGGTVKPFWLRCHHRSQALCDGPWSSPVSTQRAVRRSSM